MSRGGVIGRGNRLPWHSSADLKHFKKLTLGSTVIMGRKTFESLGKPLAGRENFVLTRASKGTPPRVPEVQFFSSLEGAFEAISTEKAFIIGGGELYRETLDQVDGIYLTQVAGEYKGDTFYPARSLEELEGRGFQVISREPSTDDRKLEFIELRRKD
jgi:dihydrofolate reductase